ncbi:MAG: hypothetical protein WBA22_17600 [Candidatus Methanofastidiosia archaeon]
MPEFKIYYRIGMAGEKKILSHSSVRETFHGICFSANVACFGKTWVSQFINDLGKPFFIDPMTHAFQFPLNRISKENVLKKSFSQLLEVYGEPILEAVSSGHTVQPHDFDGNSIATMVENTLELQRNIAKPVSSSQKTLLEFEEWLDEKKQEIEPEFLVLPYFWFDSPETDWYDLNLKILEQSRDHSKQLPIYAVICTTKNVYSQEEWISEILSDFRIAEGLLLWISDFDEYRMDSPSLVSFLNFARRLSEENKIVMMYGSFFSMIASKFGLAGISPGIGISESKNVEDQPTGGVFSKKYYVPQAKIMVNDADARAFYADHPRTLCTCEICQGNKIVNVGDIHEFFDELSPMDAKRHYCLCKDSELKEIEFTDIKGIETMLLSNIEFCRERIGDLHNIPFGHLARWLTTLQEVG